jgi:hypothetical protein
MPDGEKPLKFSKNAETRWISIEPTISKLLQQWDELKLHFELARKNWYSAEMIYNMLNDKKCTS